MAMIKIDYDTLNQQASVLSEVKSDYEALIAQMKSITSTVESGWGGDASIAYQQKLIEYIGQATVLVFALEEFRKYAMDAVQGFEIVDQECANAILGSF